MQSGRLDIKYLNNQAFSIMMTPYEIGPFRPPSEAGSLLVRVTRNCPWNKCEFCPLYKADSYETRPVNEVLEELESRSNIDFLKRREYNTAFLQDADSIRMPTSDLIEILKKIKELYPKITRITTYARADSLTKKSVEELKELHDAGLTRIHRGLETGYDALLKYMKKGATAKLQIEGGLKVKQAEISLSDYSPEL